MFTGRTKIAIAAVLGLSFFGAHSVSAQRSQFPKSSRGIASSVAQPRRIQTPAQTQRAAQNRQQLNRRPQQQYNHHSFYSSRSGSRNRYSSNQFRGRYVPYSSYGPGFRSGFGGPVLGVPIYGNSFGLSFGNTQFRSYNPAYGTYGAYLNTGVGNAGVLGANAIGSSVAAQALQRARNQQQIVPATQSANTARDAEILRLQIELERAKQQLANQNLPQAQQQQVLKPAVVSPPQTVDNSEAIDQLGLAPIIETNELAASSHLKAERAFRSGNYGQAARFVGLASSLDESNGQLMLFAAQAHLANGEYRDAASALVKADSLLDPQDMSYVVQNYKLFYGQNDFVPQMQQLSTHLKSSPDDARAWLLRGFQYGALGYPGAARKDLARAKELGANAAFTDKLLSQFSAEVEMSSQ